MYNKSEKVKNNYSSNNNWTTFNFNQISITEPTYAASYPGGLEETTQKVHI